MQNLIQDRELNKETGIAENAREAYNYKTVSPRVYFECYRYKVTLLFKVVTLNTKKNTRGAGARPRGRGGWNPEGEGTLWTVSLCGGELSLHRAGESPDFYATRHSRLRAAGVNRGWVSLEVLVTLVSSHTNVRKT